MCSGKTQEGSKLSPPADIDTQWKQEVNAKVELNYAWLSFEGLPNTQHLGKIWEIFLDLGI